MAGITGAKVRMMGERQAGRPPTLLDSTKMRRKREGNHGNLDTATPWRTGRTGDGRFPPFRTTSRILRKISDCGDFANALLTGVVQQGAERGRRLGLHVRQDVRVDFQRHRHLRVSQPFADDVDGCARLHSSVARMPRAENSRG